MSRHRSPWTSAAADVSRRFILREKRSHNADQNLGYQNSKPEGIKEGTSTNLNSDLTTHFEGPEKLKETYKNQQRSVFSN